MPRKLFVSAVPVAMLLLAHGTRAQSTAPALQTPEQTAFFLAPYLSSSTLMVAHVDIGALDSAALFKYLDQQLAAIPGSEGTRKSLPMAQTAFDLFLVRARQLGVRHLYMVGGQTDIMMTATSGGLGGVLLVPLPKDADAKPIIALFGSPGFSNGAATAVLPNNVLAMGSPDAIKRLQNPPALAAAPNVAPAFTPSAPLQVALLLSPDIQRVLHEMPFTLPPVLGNQPITTYTEGLRSLSVNVELSPQVSATLAFSATDAAAAGRIADAANALLASLLKSEWFTHDLQSSPPDAKDKLGAFIGSLHFAASGATAAVHLDASQVSALVTTVLVPDVAASRERALRVQVSGNIRQLLVGCINYADTHNGQFPPTLETLITDKLVKDAALLTSPRDLKNKTLTYHPWTADQLKRLHAAELPMIWENPDAPSDPLAVGFADGHVEIYRQRSAVDELLKNAETKGK